MLDKTIKTKKSVDNIYDIAEKKSRALDSMIAREQASMGKLVDLDKGLKDIRTAVDNMAAEKDALKKEIQELSDQVENTVKTRGSNMTQKRKAVSDAEDKVKGVGNRVKNLVERHKKIGNEIDDITGNKE